MILLLGGTSDSRDLAAFLTGRGLSVLVSAVTGYGGQLARETNATKVHTGALTTEDLQNIVITHRIKAIVDATHPYAERISTLAMNTAEKLQIGYCRYERPETKGISTGKVFLVSSLTEAAATAANLGSPIFLTIGSKGLPEFLRAPCLKGCRIIVRVLPTPGVIEQCQMFGLTPQDIIAMQGPFSLDLNIAMFRQTGARVLVTKDSGPAGGADAKMQAAAALGIPVVVIVRPKLNYQNKCVSFEQIIDYLGEIL